MIKVASTQFSLEKVQSQEHFWLRFIDLVKKAKSEDASVVVFPEYFSLSLMLFELKTPTNTFNDCLKNSLNHSKNLVQKVKMIAAEYKIAIVLGTLPWPTTDGIVNRSLFIDENGMDLIAQDKIFMTRFEDEIWNIKGGKKEVITFKWKNALCAILTCYDSEFSVLSKTLAQSGVQILFVPSCTDTEHGYWRVRHCCHARTVENQLFVIMSSVVNGDLDFEEIDIHYGQSGIFSPCDSPFPAHGTLALGQVNHEGLSFAELNLDKLNTIRTSGSVLNLRDSTSILEIPFKNIQHNNQV